MIKLCREVDPINSFQRRSCSSKYLEGMQSWKQFLNRCIFTHFTTILVLPSLWRYVPSAVFQKLLHWFAWLCNTPLESLLNGLIGGKFISRRGAIVINTLRAPLVSVWSVTSRITWPLPPGASILGGIMQKSSLLFWGGEIFVSV